MPKIHLRVNLFIGSQNSRCLTTNVKINFNICCIRFAYSSDLRITLLKSAFAKGIRKFIFYLRKFTLRKLNFFSFFFFLGFLASVGMKSENFSSPFCEITFQKRNNMQIG